MLRIQVPAGLQRVSKPGAAEVFVGRARPSGIIARAASDTPAHDGESIACSESDTVELEWSDGTCIVRTADDVVKTFPQDSGVVELARASRSRDGLTSALTRIAIYPAAKAIAAAAVTQFDKWRVGGRPELFRLDEDGVRANGEPQGSDPILVLVCVGSA